MEQKETGVELPIDQNFANILTAAEKDPLVELCGYLGPDPNEDFCRLYKEYNPYEYLKVPKDCIRHWTKIPASTSYKRDGYPYIREGYGILYVKECTMVTCVSIKRECMPVREAALEYAETTKKMPFSIGGTGGRSTTDEFDGGV